MTATTRHVLQAALLGVASAAAAWTVQGWLRHRSLARRRAAQRADLARWENEGGSPVAIGNPQRVVRAQEVPR